jgi:tRNA-modifying protein YgfZ
MPVKISGHRLTSEGAFCLQDASYDQWQAWRQHEDANSAEAAAALEWRAGAILRASGVDAEPAAHGHAPGCACIDLNAFMLLGLDGPDARSFLQGYVTCDVNQLTAGNALPGAFTNLQGRVAADLLLLEVEGMPAFAIHRSIAAGLRAGLQKYLHFSKSRLVDLSDRYLLLGIVAPNGAEDPLSLSPSTMALAPLATADCDGGRAVREPGVLPRFRLLLSPDAARSVWSQYRDAGAIGHEDLWTLIDIVSGIAHVHSRTANEFLPQMLDLDRVGAISFSKGCYLGQEIVARAQHRGQVKRRLRRLAWRGSAPPAPGAVLRDADGQARATLISAARTSRAPGGWRGLALAVGGPLPPEPLEAEGVAFTPASGGDH